MADPKKYLEDWSAITPTDFGLHAAYWTGKPDEAVTFRPILGWITYNAKEVGSPPDTLLKNGFGAVVLSDAWWPLWPSRSATMAASFRRSWISKRSKPR